MTIGCFNGITAASNDEDPPVEPVQNWDATISSNVRVADDSQSYQEAIEANNLSARVRRWRTTSSSNPPINTVFPIVRDDMFTYEYTAAVKCLHINYSVDDYIVWLPSSGQWNNLYNINQRCYFLVLSFPINFQKLGYGAAFQLYSVFGTAPSYLQTLLLTFEPNQRIQQLNGFSTAVQEVLPNSLFRANVPFVVGIKKRTNPSVGWSFLYPGCNGTMHNVDDAGTGSAPPDDDSRYATPNSFYGFHSLRTLPTGTRLYEIGIYNPMTNTQFINEYNRLKQKWNAD